MSSTPVHTGQPPQKYDEPRETPVLPMSPVSTSTSTSNSNVVMVQPNSLAPVVSLPPQGDKMTVDASFWIMASFISIWSFPLTGCPAFVLSCYMLYKAISGEHDVARRALDPVRLLTIGSFFIATVLGLMAVFVVVIVLIRDYNTPMYYRG